MTTKVSYCKNTTYLLLCFVKSLPWLFNRNLLTDFKISFYRNIVRQNVSCELGLRMKIIERLNFGLKITCIFIPREVIENIEFFLQKIN
jgi:hypothetical protein